MLTEEGQLAARLPPRLREILILIANGYSNVAICDKLNVRSQTLSKYLDMLRWRLEIRERASLAIFAVRSGLCKIEELELR